MAESDQQRDMWVDALKAKIGSLANSDEGRTLIADRFKRTMQEVGMDDQQIKMLYNVKLLDQTKPEENMLNVAGLVMQTAVTLPVGQAGLLVVKLFDNSPATIAGLRVNEDLIMTLNGQPFVSTRT
jgi:S1-C subfamily serine protease